MNADTIRGQQDAYKRWRDKVGQNPMRGATELPYIKLGRNFFRHRETFEKSIPSYEELEFTKLDKRLLCQECSKEMKFIIANREEMSEFYCDNCRISITQKEINDALGMSIWRD